MDECNGLRESEREREREKEYDARELVPLSRKH